MADHERNVRGVLREGAPVSAGTETPVVEKKKKDKEEKSRLHNFAISGLNFFLAFLVGALVIVIFFVLTEKLQFTNNFHLEFWIKAIISLILASLILKVADIINEKKTAFSKAVPTALLTLFLVLVVWHYGYISQPFQVGKKDSTEKNSGDDSYSHLVPTYTFDLDKDETSPWIDFPTGYNMKTWGDKGSYDLIYSNSPEVRAENRHLNLPDLNGDEKVKIKSLKDNQKIKIYLTRL